MGTLLEAVGRPSQLILTLLSPEGFRNWEAEEVNLEGVVANARLTPPSTQRR